MEDSDDLSSHREMLTAWALRIAPAALYQTLLTQVSVSRQDWYSIFQRRIQETLFVASIDIDADDERMNQLPQVFQSAIYHLRIMGLIKEQRRGSELSYEKVALVFCSGE